jgi:hypothetical protein
VAAWLDVFCATADTNGRQSRTAAVLENGGSNTMKGTRLRRPSPALVIAILALFIALCGASYAAMSLAPGAVKSRHIAMRAIKAAHISTGAVGKRAIASGAIGTHEVRNHSLRARDFQASALPASTTTVHSDRTNIAPNQGAIVTASCPDGQHATGGGWLVPVVAGLLIQASYPSDANGQPLEDGSTPTGWAVIVRNGPNFEGNFVTYAVCES